MFFYALLVLQLTVNCFSQHIYQDKDEFKNSEMQSQVYTITYAPHNCTDVEIANKMLAVMPLYKNMYGVSNEEIELGLKKIWFIYNNHQDETEHNKLVRVREQFRHIGRDFKWSVVVLKDIANSIAHHKFFVYYVHCKYFIGIAGYRC